MLHKTAKCSGGVKEGFCQRTQPVCDFCAEQNSWRIHTFAARIALCSESISQAIVCTELRNVNYSQFILGTRRVIRHGNYL